MSEESIKIEKGIVVPSANKSMLTYALRQCEVGDSFLFMPKSNASLHASARQIGMCIITRRQPDGSYRIWRKS